MATATLSPAAIAAINCSNEIQFRFSALNVSNNKPFTNFNDL